MSFPELSGNIRRDSSQRRAASQSSSLAGSYLSPMATILEPLLLSGMPLSGGKTPEPHREIMAVQGQDVNWSRQSILQVLPLSSLRT
jgi:hypothetical protein